MINLNRNWGHSIFLLIFIHLLLNSSHLCAVRWSIQLYVNLNLLLPAWLCWSSDQIIFFSLPPSLGMQIACSTEEDRILIHFIWSPKTKLTRTNGCCWPAKALALCWIRLRVRFHSREQETVFSSQWSSTAAAAEKWNKKKCEVECERAREGGSMEEEVVGGRAATCTVRLAGWFVLWFSYIVDQRYLVSNIILIRGFWITSSNWT